MASDDGTAGTGQDAQCLAQGAVTRNARIVGKVEYREGDGANITIRPGPCEVDETAMDATISWTDGDSRGSAAMPIADYRRYVSSKALQIIGTKAA
jgi:hypothetical protein